MDPQALNPQATVGGDAVPSDGELLEQFVRDRNAEAFARLMERHGPYILGVCRRVTTHAQDAEDVFQACFLELVRHPAAICRQNSVAGWLQTIAVRLSLKARARRAQQPQQEVTQFMQETAVEEPDISWREVREILEHELSQLSEDLRTAVILCLFEGRTQEEAAEFLNLNPRTVKDRVHRGRTLLSARLTRRGISLAVMGALLTGGSVQAAVPVTLGQITIAGATGVVQKSVLAGLVSPSVLGLTGASTAKGVWASVVLWMTGSLLCVGTAAVVWNKSMTPARPTIRASFRDSQFDSRLFKWTGPTSRKFTKPEAEGLRITLPPEGGPAQPLGLVLQYPVRGDFELEAKFELLNLPPAAAKWGAGVTVYFFMEDQEWNGVWFGKMNEQGRGPFFYTGHRVGKGEERQTKLVDATATTGERGITRLRVARQGRIFTLSAAEGEAGPFRQLHRLEVSEDDLDIVRLATDPSWSDRSEVDVRLLDFVMSAEEFVGYRPK